MNTTIFRMNAWLASFACTLVLVTGSGAYAKDETGAGGEQAHGRAAAVGRVHQEEARQPGREREENGQGRGRKEIVEEFQEVEATERQLQMRLMNLHQKFRPGHPASRALEAQLDELDRRKKRLLEKHPFLLLQPKKPVQPQGDRIELEAKLRALEAKERVLQLHLDEVKKERELLLKKHPEPQRR